MNILSIDTSTDWCGISFFKDNQCKKLIEKHIPKKHSEVLPVLFDSIIKDTGFNINSLDAIAISIGPGSFTGLRIGLGFSKGLAYALNKPIVPVPSLEVIANDLDVEFNDFIVLLFSHRNVVYHQEFINKKPKDLPKSSAFDEIDINKNIVQYGCENLLRSKSFHTTHPSAEVVGNLALQNFNDWKIDEPFTLTSNYISPFEIG